ncbi:MAG TPA: hypothetical protein VFO35_13020 [Steroidobacteraceae bacterium]|nr:hypothetical protein [Steroidobacteraceae bacterium]
MANVFRSRLLAACVAGLLASAAAHADVTMQEQMSLSGSGMMKMANMTGTTTTTISGDRARTESNMRFESGLMRTFAGGMGDHVEIVRLGEDKIFSLNPKKKTYTETTFAEMRAKMQEAMDAMNKGQASQQQATSGVDESECEWLPPKSELKRTGEKASIAGFQAERITITATQSCKSKKDGQICDFGLAFDQWLAPGFEASAEAQNYQRAYAEKLGLGTASSRDFAERAQSMFGRYKGIWSELATQMAKMDVKGYAVKSSFGLGVGGPQCQNTQAVEQQGGPQSPPSIGGALGGALGGMFKKKQPEQQQAAAPPPTMAGGLMPLMTMSTELISINRDAAPAQAFEVPTDYKKTKD